MIDELLTETLRERAESRADLTVLAQRAARRGRRRIATRRLATGSTALVVTGALVIGIAVYRNHGEPSVPVGVSPLVVVPGVPGLPTTDASRLPSRAEVTTGDPDELPFALDAIPAAYDLYDVRFAPEPGLLLRDDRGASAQLQLLDKPMPIEAAESTQAITVGQRTATLYRSGDFHRVVWEIADGAGVWMHVTAGSDALAMELAEHVHLDRRTHCAAPAAPVALPTGYTVENCDLALRLLPEQQRASLVGATITYSQTGTAHRIILIVTEREPRTKDAAALDRKVAGWPAALVPGEDGMQLQLPEFGELSLAMTTSRGATEAEVLAMGRTVRSAPDISMPQQWLPATPG
ncbi:hypothetical protein ACQP2P_30120 [Dactylosporangium sp. CA-139114]|uniref:hypothetical protein n=1 Tax=Dactylosporangium sp. CA-139114 TaxID=3239931 RepID=UPI003D990A13